MKTYEVVYAFIVRAEDESSAKQEADDRIDGILTAEVGEAGLVDLICTGEPSEVDYA